MTTGRKRETPADCAWITSERNEQCDRISNGLFCFRSDEEIKNTNISLRCIVSDTRVSFVNSKPIVMI